MKLRFKSRLAKFLLSLLISLGTPGGLVSAACAQQDVSEYQLKAAFVYQFLNFVEYPNGPVPNHQQDLALCIGEREKSLNAFMVLHGEKAQGKTIRVTAFVNQESLENCDVLFLPESPSFSSAQILPNAQSSSVLTIGDSKEFWENGGMINFVDADKKLRFDVNKTIAEKAGFKFRAKFLKRARTVR